MADHFEFILGRNTEVQYKVKVFKPVRTRPTPRYQLNSRPRRAEFNDLLHMLHEDHILIEPNPTSTLVLIPNTDRRIDTQPNNGVYRNIHFQAGNRSYAVVTAARGAELCFIFGFNQYGSRLLRYIKQGLSLSFEDGNMYHINVIIERREHRERRGDRDYNDWFTTNEDVREIGSSFRQILKIRERSIEGRARTEINNHKIEKSSDKIDHVVVAIEKTAIEINLAKIPVRGYPLVAAKQIPGVSTILGVFLAEWRITNGDWIGALLEVVSGVAADFPGAGTVVSMAIDGGLLVKNIEDALNNEQEHNKLMEDDMQRIRVENGTIRRELEEILPSSQIYGCGRDSCFDESNLANMEDIVQIRIWSGYVIDGIQVKYRSQIGAQHGGIGGNYHEFDLETDEKITAISGTILDGNLVSSLTFSTDSCRQETFGTKIGEEFKFEMTNGSYLAAIKGYDAYRGGSKRYPGWRGNYELLPAIGFICKC